MLVLLTGCSNAVMEPKYERNPRPRERFVVVADMEGAPGPFDVATANVAYEIGPTKECMPSAEPISGVFPTPDRAHIGQTVRKLSETRYEFVVYADGMLNKDYFGKGVCRWIVESVTFNFSRTTNPIDGGFSAWLSESGLRSQQPISRYFRKNAYFDRPQKPPEGFFVVSESGLDRAQFQTRYGAIAATDEFHITLTAKEAGNGH